MAGRKNGLGRGLDAFFPDRTSVVKEPARKTTTKTVKTEKKSDVAEKQTNPTASPRILTADWTLYFTKFLIAIFRQCFIIVESISYHSFLITSAGLIRAILRIRNNTVRAVINVIPMKIPAQYMIPSLKNTIYAFFHICMTI